MMHAGDDKGLRCSFCNKSQDVVGKLISSPSDYPRAYICDECIAVCNSILDDDARAAETTVRPEQGPPMLSAVMTDLASFAEFSNEKMVKSTIAQGETLFVGLNCFEPGQIHAAHSHTGQDKLYVVLEGYAEIQVGEENKIIEAGGGAFAPSGVMHSIKNIGVGRMVVLAVLAPPPVHK